MSNLDPAAFPRSPKDLARWQKWVEDRLKYLGSARALIERGSVAGGVVTVREILTNPAGPVQFVNTDTGTCPADGADIPIVLTHVPKPGSEQVFYNGTPLKRVDWTRTDTLLTIPGETWFRAGRVAWVDYSYDATAADIAPVVASPEDNTSTTDTTPLIAGTGAPGYGIEVHVDGAVVGTTTVAEDGSWSFTSAALAAGTHTVYVLQGSPDGTLAKSNTVSFSIVTTPAAFDSKTTVVGDQTSIALPGVSADGDLLVLVMHARDTATCSDARFTPKYVDTVNHRWGIWLGTDDGSGDPVAVNLSSPSGGGLDGCGALVRITGAPLLPVTSEQTSDGTGAVFTPTIPTSGSLGVLAVVCGVSLSAATVTDDQLGNWTTRARVAGDGSGLTSVYVGTASGLPPAQFGSNDSGGYSAWAAGIQ